MKKAPILLFFLLTFFWLRSQTDSLSKHNFQRLPGIHFSLREDHLAEDTILDSHFNYFKPDFNGNLGLPSQELYLENRLTDNLGLRYFVSNYRQHFFNAGDIAFYQTSKPYTRAFALAGQRQEQVIRLTHAQTIRKQFSYTLKFNRYKSNGFYRQQTAINENVIATVNYANKSNSYKLYSWLLFNKLRHNENGGLKYDTLFPEFLSLNKELLDVNLREARRATKNLQAGLLQKFKLNSKSDTTTSHYLYHSFEYHSDYLVYYDAAAGSGFYDQVYISNDFTLDSANTLKLVNSAGYSFERRGNTQLNFFAENKNEIARVHQFVLDTHTVNHIVSAGFHTGTKVWDLAAKGQYVISGNNSNDYFFLAGGKIWFSKYTRLSISLASESRRPDVFYTRYYGNHFQWNMNMKNVQTNSLNARFSFLKNKLFLESESRHVRNMIWFLLPDAPSQNSKDVLMTRSGLGAKLKFRKIRLDLRADYQFTNAAGKISLPPVIAGGQLYFDSKLFKNNLHLQTGFQATYYSLFESNAYNPATNTYYASGRKELGNYPFIDFFINAEIKPVRFFIKIDHANQGLSGSNYFLTPDYPMPDRAFKFGFTWLFWD